MSAFLADHYDWLRALHLIFVITWMAGLFYLPRLFVYHADVEVAGGRMTDMPSVRSLTFRAPTGCQVLVSRSNVAVSGGLFHLLLPESQRVPV